MDIKEATTLYEQWLGGKVELVPPDLDHKHEQMALGPFEFLSATCYRWAQIWQEACPELANAHVVLSLGDPHIENFGTWRDNQGRLIWGVYDFDEAFPLPWTADLLRLATSAHVAIEADYLAVGRSKACSAITQGYKDCLSRGGRPFVLAEDHDWLRKFSLSKSRNPSIFWRKLDELTLWPEPVPPSAANALTHLLPRLDLEHRIAHRTASLGSLGRQRWVALADWQGGRIAREAKALAPSAWCWGLNQTESSGGHHQRLLDTAVRVADPHLKVFGQLERSPTRAGLQ